MHIHAAEHTKIIFGSFQACKVLQSVHIYVLVLMLCHKLGNSYNAANMDVLDATNLAWVCATSSNATNLAQGHAIPAKEIYHLPSV